MKIERENIKILFMDTVEELGGLVKNILINDYNFNEDNFVKANLTRFGNVKSVKTQN